MPVKPSFIPVTGPMGPVTRLADGRIVSAYVERHGVEEVETDHGERWTYLRTSTDQGRS